MVTLRALERSAFVRESLPGLAEAARTVVPLTLRNLATVGGNLLESGDLAPLLLVLDAGVKIVRKDRERTASLSDLLAQGLKRGEVLADVSIPLPPFGQPRRVHQA